MAVFRIVVFQILFVCLKSCQLQNGSLIYSSGGRYSTNLTQCVYPSNEAEIIDLILMAAEINASVRCTGKSHSKSGVNMMDDTIGKNLFMMNLSVYMNDVINLNIEKNTFTFAAGLSIWDVLMYLDSNNLTLKYWGSGPLVTNFVGNVMTGSHGMGSYKNPIKTVASNIIGLKMILSNGTMIEVNNTYNQDIFNAARISFGSLGIITQITVQTVPQFTATRYSENYFPNVSDLNVATQIIENNITYYNQRYDTSYGKYSIFEHHLENIVQSIINDSIRMPSKCKPDINEVNNVNNVNYVMDMPVCTDNYWKAITWFPSARAWGKTAPINEPIEYEMFVDAKLWKKALLGIFEWIFKQKEDETELWIATESFYNQTKEWYDITIEWRFVGNDDIWLSPAYQMDVFQIGMHFRGVNSFYINDLWTSQIHEYLKDNFGVVRYHWGKQSLSKYCDLQQSYPKLHDFKELRDRLDPNGMFINKFIKDKLGLCEIDDVPNCCCTNTTCKSYDTYHKSEESIFWKIVAIIGGSVVAFMLVVSIISFGFCRCRKKNEQYQSLYDKETNKYTGIETAKVM